MAAPLADVVGIVLAGGRSTRFGHDKRLVLVDDQPLVHLAIRGVAAVASHVIVVIGPTERPLPLPLDLASRVELARDRDADAGPLAGLLAGVEAAPASERAIVVGADMPSLVPAVLEHLLRAAETAPHVWTLENPDPGIVGPLPLAGRTRVLAASASALLEHGERSLRALVRATNAGRVPAADWRTLDATAATLRDIDRPTDLGS